MAETAADRKDGNLVHEYMQGSVRVRIFDGYVIKSDSEKAKSDERIARICWNIVAAARAAGKDI